jgi:hypothetical protein
MVHRERVFRLVNGERVRIHGDKRDPNKSYGHVVDCSTGEEYLLEFNEKQEKETAAKGLKLEVERQLREERKRLLKVESIEFRESLIYEQRIVAILDVLGWENAISKSTTDTILRQELGVSLHNVKTYIKFNAGLGDSKSSFGDLDLQITQFSDSILISILPDSISENILGHALNFIVDSFRANGFVVRGGVTIGEIIHRKSVAYGPALIQAHMLEDTIAKYPRVILDKELASSWGKGVAVKDRAGDIIGYKKLWRLDQDDWFFFDFLQPPFSMLGSTIPDEALFKHLQRWKTFIQSKLDNHNDDLEMISKYNWMAKYFDFYCVEAGCGLSLSNTGPSV